MRKETSITKSPSGYKVSGQTFVSQINPKRKGPTRQKAFWKYYMAYGSHDTHLVSFVIYATRHSIAQANMRVPTIVELSSCDMNVPLYGRVFYVL